MLDELFWEWWSDSYMWVYAAIGSGSIFRWCDDRPPPDCKYVVYNKWSGHDHVGDNAVTLYQGNDEWAAVCAVHYLLGNGRGDDAR